jgi:hypothetical protein
VTCYRFTGTHFFTANTATGGCNILNRSMPKVVTAVRTGDIYNHSSTSCPNASQPLLPDCRYTHRYSVNIAVAWHASGKSYYVAHRGGLKVRPHQRQRKAVIDAKVGGNRKSRQAEGACR